MTTSNHKPTRVPTLGPDQLPVSAPEVPTSLNPIPQEEMEALQNKLAAIAQKNINVAGIGEDLIDEVLEPSLRDVAARTDTTIDDAIVDLILPNLLPAIKRRIRKIASAIDPI